METQISRLRCPLCGSTEASKEFTKRDFSYYRCEACQHVFVFPPPSFEQNIDHYERSYTENHLAEMTPWFQELARRRVKLIREHVSEMKESSILDVGCGWGFFLAAAAGEGSQVYGIDYSSACVDFARKRFSLPVVSGDILTGLEEIVSKRKFDVITFWHVLEHLDRPGDMLRIAFRGLRKGGFLIVNSPNIDSAIFTLVGKWWSWIYAPGHVQYFSLRSLEQWLVRTELEVVRSETWTDAPNLYFLIEEALAFRIADLLNRLGGRHGRMLSQRLEAFLYSSFHQMWIQKQLRRLYNATPFLDRRLRKRHRGHEFLIAARRRCILRGSERGRGVFSRSAGRRLSY